MNIKNIKNTENIKYIVSALVIGLIVGGFGIYFIMTQNDSTEISRIKKFNSNSINKESADKGVLYTSNKYGFSFRYPKGLILKEFNEGNESQTIVFQKLGDVELGFQIYIAPYTESTITGERILLDIPSGNIQDLREEQLTKGLLVATFISTDPFVGKTKEIWFIDGEYLYQATTFIDLDSWLTEIIKTWKFI